MLLPTSVLASRVRQARIWALWVVIAGNLVTPFLYNPLALDLPTIWRDLREWDKWASHGGLDGEGGTSGDSWLSWWEKIEPKPEEYDDTVLAGSALMSYIYLSLATSTHARAPTLD